MPTVKLKLMQNRNKKNFFEIKLKENNFNFVLLGWRDVQSQSCPRCAKWQPPLCHMAAAANRQEKHVCLLLFRTLIVHREKLWHNVWDMNTGDALAFRENFRHKHSNIHWNQTYEDFRVLHQPVTGTDLWQINFGIDWWQVCFLFFRLAPPWSPLLLFFATSISVLLCNDVVFFEIVQMVQL